jgi:uncharacterized protein (DUF885 family)
LRQDCRRVALVLGAFAVAICAPIRAADGDAAFRSLEARYFAVVFAEAPSFATAVGVHDYDERLDDLSAAAVAARIAREERTLDEVGAIAVQTLSPEAALDRQVLENHLRDDLLFDRTLETWRHKPDDYVQTVSGALYALIARDFAPAAVRLRAAIARENAVPAVVRAAETNLTTVDGATAAIAVADARGTAVFLRTAVPAAFRTAGTASERAALSRSTALAAGAVDQLASLVERRFAAHPRGTYAIGAAAFAARLKYEEAIDMPLPEYERIGERALARTRAAMAATARRIDPRLSVPQVLARAARQHPSAGGLLSAADADLTRLRAFVAARHIIELPAGANLRVDPTPEFLRATTVASMDAPGPLEKKATRAYYHVTPVDPHDAPADREAYLETFNDFERPIVSAHEVYPGHFTAYAVQRGLPLSLTAKLLGASSFVEGWAHYGEQLVVDEGWGEGDPRVRLMQLKEAVLRNARFVVGVRMHVHGMTVAQAEHFFAEQAYLDRVDARIESRRGTQDPTYGYYTLGKLEILKLREDYRRKLGAGFTLAGFHAALLAHGNPPLPLLRPLLLGDADDGRALPD